MVLVAQVVQVVQEEAARAEQVAEMKLPVVLAVQPVQVPVVARLATTAALQQAVVVLTAVLFALAEMMPTGQVRAVAQVVLVARLGQPVVTVAQVLKED